jgi:DNA (cytosine-5)-methyltransferase 1
MYAFAELMKKIKPHVVSMENVPEITHEKVFDDFVETLKSLGYHVTWTTVYCPDYGIPQSRKRLVLLASKLGKIKLIPKTHSPSRYKTVRQTIGRLVRLKDGDGSKKDALHRASKLSVLNKRRIEQSKPGGTWRDWQEELRAPCHRKETGSSYTGVYSRMEWDKPSPTITTQFYSYGTGRFGHPEQNRALSLREGAMLQTFPRGYAFIKPKEKLIIGRIGIQIGNAVPVKLGVVIGMSIVDHIRAHREAGK